MIPMSDDAADPIDVIETPTEAEAPPPPPKVLTPAAQRALAEAVERRAAYAAKAEQLAKEFQGPTGPEPTRYGDWETKGIISDF